MDVVVGSIANLCHRYSASHDVFAYTSWACKGFCAKAGARACRVRVRPSFEFCESLHAMVACECIRLAQNSRNGAYLGPGSNEDLGSKEDMIERGESIIPPGI